jgi:hypothetical protein
MNMTKKKALAVVYDPHNLLEFLWYYATCGKEFEWTALCLPNGYKGEYIGDYCERCGIFNRVIRKKVDFLTVSSAKKARIFASMLGNAILKRQRAYVASFLKDFEVDVEDYDRFVVMTDVGLVSGMVVALGIDKEVVVLEDGTGDYLERSYSQIKNHLNKVGAWEGLLLAWMGYANPGHFFPLKTNHFAVKYCSKPSQMIYRDYKEIRQLYDFEKTDLDCYNQLILKAFGSFDAAKLQKSDIFFLTLPLDDFTSEQESYVKRITENVNELIASGKRKIVIKRHPRDSQTYAFSSDADIYEIDNSVPSEVLLPYLKGKDLVFIGPCSTMLNLNEDSNILILYLNGLSDSQEYKFNRYLTMEQMKEYLGKMDLKRYRIKVI